MKLHKIDKINNCSNAAGSRKMILFFAGWGMDECPFKNFAENEYDLYLVYDYNNLNSFDESCNEEKNSAELILNNIFEQYDEINIVAWSLGVWAVSYVMDVYFRSMGNLHKNSLEKFRHCIAINGTPIPFNDSWGIPESIVDGTINSLPDSLEKFYLRMCGSASTYKKFSAIKPRRSALDQKDELINIRKQYCFCNPFQWTKAVISTKDRIFPPENMKLFWDGYKLSGMKSNSCQNMPESFEINSMESPHYPFERDDFKLSELFNPAINTKQ